MNLREYDDELQNIQKEKESPTSLKYKTIFISGRFTKYNTYYLHNIHNIHNIHNLHNIYINSTYMLHAYIRICKEAIITSNFKHADIICWLLPYKETKAIKYAKENKIPIIKIHTLLKMRK